MTLDFYFDPKRFGYLIKREGHANVKLFLIALGAISGLLLIIFLITVFQWDNRSRLVDATWDMHQYFFIPPYLIVGVLFTSLAYKDLLHVNKTYAYLTLPVSNFERMLSMLLLTTVIYTAFFILYYSVYATLLNALGMMISQLEFAFFDPTVAPVPKAIKLYLVIQSVFLLGAAAFKKFPFLFTLLTLFLAAVALIIVTLILVRIIFADHFVSNVRLEMNRHISSDMEHYLADVLKILENAFWYALAPLCWVITYLKLKEREV